MKVSVRLSQDELKKIIIEEVKRTVRLPENDSGWPGEWSVKLNDEGTNGALLVTAVAEIDP